MRQGGLLKSKFPSGGPEPKKLMHNTYSQTVKHHHFISL